MICLVFFFFDGKKTIWMVQIFYTIIGKQQHGDSHMVLGAFNYIRQINVCLLPKWQTKFPKASGITY